MQSWEEKILIKQEGQLEGKQELMRKLSNKFSIKQISEMLEIDISEVENVIKEVKNEPQTIVYILINREYIIAECKY